MANNKLIFKCGYCGEHYCGECSENENWQKFCSSTCEDMYEEEVEREERKSDEKAMQNVSPEKITRSIL